MNKRLPLLLSLLGMILLAASLAYWILQLYQPPQRPLAAAPHTGLPDPAADAAAMLFGGQPVAATATSYQLTGIVAAGHDSVAIIVAEGSPPKALKVGHELVPGVKLAEVHPRYVMLLDAGVMKRVDLATDAKPAAPMGGMPGAMGGGEAAGGAPNMQPSMQPGMQPGVQQNMQQNMQPNMQPGTQLPAQQAQGQNAQGGPPQAGAQTAPPWPPATANSPAPDPASVPEPPMSPGAVQAPPAEGPPANPNGAPSQPPRTTGSPVSQNPTTQ